MPCEDCRCRNPRVSCPCCIAAFSLFITILYAIPLIAAHIRYEQWVQTSCIATDVSMRQLQCNVKVCPSPSVITSSSTPCTEVTTLCYACVFEVLTMTTDGDRIVAYSDFYGRFSSINAASNTCQKMLASSQSDSHIPCWYQPKQSSSSRFYVSFDAPSVDVSTTPIFTFITIMGLSIITFVACHCATAKVDEHWAQQLALARERAAERTMRASRWSDYFGPFEEDPMNALRARRREGPQLQAAVEMTNINGMTTYSNPMIAASHGPST